MEVQIISKKVVKPSVPTPCHLQNMTISFMDQLLPPIIMPFIFYYPANGINHPVELVERKKRLEKSLCEVLTLFYPLAGRYIKEKFVIICNDEGVEYNEAVVNCQLSQILLGEFEIKELDRLLPNQLEESATSPLVAIQINVFKCGGLAVGLRHSHRIMDGHSSYMFINGWAKACKVGINDVVIPNFECGVLFPPRDLSGFQHQPFSKTKSELVTNMFLFDAKAISKLKLEATSATCGSEKRKPSTTEVLTALILRAQINASRARSGCSNRATLLQMLMNLRGKTFKKIPENCFANLFTRVTTRFQADESEMGLNNFIDRVREAIRNSMMEYAKPIQGNYEDDLFLKVLKPCVEISQATRKGEVDVCLYTSVVNLPFYAIDFGWGGPALTSMGQMHFKSIVITRVGDGGIQTWVTMDKEDMVYFQKDPNIVTALKPGRNIGHGTPIPRPKM